jgi:iron-sulfur cluster assembly protein
MITLTEPAARELKRLVTEQDHEGMALRVFVSPGGCSGMSYGMAFDDEPQEGDQVIDHEGVKIWVDEMSAMYLSGSEIDYADQLMGGGFNIHNPNAVRSCACGHSFDTGSDSGTARSCS